MTSRRQWGTGTGGIVNCRLLSDKFGEMTSAHVKQIVLSGNEVIGWCIVAAIMTITWREQGEDHVEWKYDHDSISDSRFMRV